MHTSFLGLSPLAQDFLKSTKDSFVKRVHRTLETLRCWSEEKMSPTISTRPPLFHIIYPYLFHTICSPWFLGSIKSKDLHMCGSCHQIRRIRFPSSWMKIKGFLNKKMCFVWEQFFINSFGNCFCGSMSSEALRVSRLGGESSPDSS